MPEPSMYELWKQAGGGTAGYDPQKYHDLLTGHGHLLRPGDEGYEEASRNLPCGWPGRVSDKNYCHRCDVFIGYGAAGVVIPPDEHSGDAEWLSSHCWACGRSREEIRERM